MAVYQTTKKKKKKGSAQQRLFTENPIGVSRYDFRAFNTEPGFFRDILRRRFDCHKYCPE